MAPARTKELQAALQRALSQGRAAWPDVALVDERFVEHALQKLGATLAGEAAEAAVLGLHAADLYLACACLHGVPRALQRFEERFLPEVAAFVAHIDSTETFADELRQVLREHLLVGRADGGAPKIVEYTGRGPLGGWLRVVAVRQALNLRRGRKEAHADGDEGGEDGMRSAAPDPEVDYLKLRYGQEFRAAFGATLAALPTDERNVLRLHYLDGLSLDQVAALYKVHRATAVRWIARARQTIMEQTLKRLTGRLQVPPDELRSLLGVVQSQLDVSIHRFLKGE